MKIVLEKLTDVRSVGMHIDRDNDDEANYTLSNDVVLLVEEMAIGYKWHSGLKEWEITYINLDGWRKDKPHKSPWWIWGNALHNWEEYPWLVEIVNKYKPIVDMV